MKLNFVFILTTMFQVIHFFFLKKEFIAQKLLFKCPSSSPQMTFKKIVEWEKCLSTIFWELKSCFFELKFCGILLQHKQKCIFQWHQLLDSLVSLHTQKLTNFGTSQILKKNDQWLKITSTSNFLMYLILFYQYISWFCNLN